jgi:BON domain
MIPDAQVLHDVIAAFDEIPELRSSRLYIDVKSRVVTIRGRVRNDTERQAAERTARRIVGSRALVLELGVAPVPKVNALSVKDTSAKVFDDKKLQLHEERPSGTINHAISYAKTPVISPLLLQRR